MTGENPSGFGLWRFALGQIPRNMNAHGDARIFTHQGDYEEALALAKIKARSRNAKTVFVI